MISEELKNDLKIKWDRMRDGMAKMGMDACLLTVDVNLYYTTGQIYSGYFYLPVDGEPWFLICLLYTSPSPRIYPFTKGIPTGGGR